MAYELQLDELNHNGKIDGPRLQAPSKNPQAQVDHQAVTQKDVLNNLDVIRKTIVGRLDDLDDAQKKDKSHLNGRINTNKKAIAELTTATAENKTLLDNIL